MDKKIKKSNIFRSDSPKEVGRMGGPNPPREFLTEANIKVSDEPYKKEGSCGL